jgi:hypothetical protein
MQLTDCGYFSTTITVISRPDPPFLSTVHHRFRLRLVVLLTKLALNWKDALRTIGAFSDSSTSIQWGAHTDGCILATRPSHAS